MKREIKFRAKVNGSYVYSDSYVNLAFYFDATKGYEQEQFTGLTDKNGQEIYEGDFIKRHHETYQVVWMYSGWCLTKINNHYMEEFYYFAHFDFTDDEFKIIGNMYENPELL